MLMEVYSTERHKAIWQYDLFNSIALKNQLKPDFRDWL